MTIKKMKQALREMRKRCAYTESCAECPFAVGKDHYCPMLYDFTGNYTTPCGWNLDWPDFGIIENYDDIGPMTVNDYQRMARRTRKAVSRKDMMEEALLGLSGEVGELCDHYKKYMHQGHDIDYDHMAEEAGDVLWYLAEIADALGLPLEEIARRNIEKLRDRYPDGFDPERSRNREGE